MFRLKPQNHYLIHKAVKVCLLVVFIGLFSAVSFAQTPKSEVKCSLVLKDRMLDVKLEIPADKFDKTGFSLSDWAGQNNYIENIYRLSATGKNGDSLPLEKTGDRTWTVMNRRQAFDLTYTVVSQKDNFMGNNVRNHFHPTLLKNYASLWGSSFLLYPDEKEIAALPVKLQIIPNEYGNIYSNFEKGADSFEDLSEFFFAAGDYRAVKKTVGGRNIQFILQGKNWKFTDEQFIDVVSRIIEAQVKYMGFYPASSETLLVTLNEGTANSQGGTVVKNVVSVYPNPQNPLQNFDILKLISHEHFHNWNNSYLHEAAGKSEGYYKWLSEGFTEYYAGLTLYREGLISEREFTSWLNDILLEYQLNPVALTATADILAENYWKSNDYNRLPYVKGTLIALLTDLQIRQKNPGKKQIDDFMRLMIKDTDKVKGYDDALILKSLDALEQGGNRKFYDDYILGAGLLPIVDVLKNSGILVTEKPRDVFDLGFTTESGKLERGVKIKQVAPDSNAFKAGLKEGDRIMSLSVNYGRPQIEAAIGVQRETETSQIRFYPKKSKNVLQIDENSVLPK